jgi:hypothetical protein
MTSAARSLIVFLLCGAYLAVMFSLIIYIQLAIVLTAGLALFLFVCGYLLFPFRARAGWLLVKELSIARCLYLREGDPLMLCGKTLRWQFPQTLQFRVELRNASILLAIIGICFVVIAVVLLVSPSLFVDLPERKWDSLIPVQFFAFGCLSISWVWLNERVLLRAGVPALAEKSKVVKRTFWGPEFDYHFIDFEDEHRGGRGSAHVRYDTDNLGIVFYLLRGHISKIGNGFLFHEVVYTG